VDEDAVIGRSTFGGEFSIKKRHVAEFRMGIVNTSNGGSLNYFQAYNGNRNMDTWSNFRSHT
jgi:hypothetical protein